VFRRSLLTLFPEWVLATGIALALYAAADRWSLPLSGFRLALILAPLAWAVFRTLSWAAHTWTATESGLLIVQQGGLSRQRKVIHLVSARDAWFRPSPLAGWLGVGHVGFRATGPDGGLATFGWSWLAGSRRFYEILQARGDLSQVDLSASPWHEMLLGLWPAIHTQWAERWSQESEWVVRLRGQWFVGDYGRFMQFCRYLLTHPGRLLQRPAWVPAAVARRWMEVLEQCRIVLPGPREGDWRLAPTIRSLRDVHTRIGSRELSRALKGR
jgi:hypothetical protein